MAKNTKTRASKGGLRGQATTVRGDGSRVQGDSNRRRAQRVTPTSERIIKETSVEWRKAIEVLANS